ncbi:carboxypeptidase Ss1. Metallo peptidase. MEROPS family M20D [Pseudarcicella hirudinis]|uniref:Carboxypeptidase Ss1. Metallo peptidase. MEROPS family M20D n=2 Tax=Pseudarcicella hirudinis TaxID=1079859 RepID=A0A1I5UIL6_9BACT|nr:carboxypeptidase Ss1. Metallo peptidase. MEROPS family M20D [Pseudarcicella hirudinis]
MFKNTANFTPTSSAKDTFHLQTIKPQNYQMRKIILSSAFLLFFSALRAQNPAPLKVKVAQKAESLEQKVIAWRRDFHQNPELGNREFKTGEKIAAHLRSLGIEVKTGVAKTGVVGILKGGKPGPVIALRADMDGLPVKERVDVPFASKATGEYNGQAVSIMHACGHDSHVAILMGTAEILASMKKDLKGTVKFIFQPAEEGAPEGEEGGAALMVKEGVLENPKVDVIFGLHINAQTEVGKIRYKPGGTMASSDWFKIKIKGKQAHGATPWQGTDPIVTASQIIMGLQTVVSRNAPLTETPVVVTVGQINGGVRSNIIPEEVNMNGTIRTLDPNVQDFVHERIKSVTTNIAESAGATADVSITRMCPVTYNDIPLTEMMVPTLEATAGKDNVSITPAATGAEDFSFYQQKVPGLFFFLGGAPKGKPASETASHHTPDFYIDESGFVLGMKAMTNLVIDYMEMKKEVNTSGK